MNEIRRFGSSAKPGFLAVVVVLFLAGVVLPIFVEPIAFYFLSN